MRKLLVPAAVLTLMAPSLALAQAAPGSVQGTVDVTGVVSSQCQISVSSAVINIPELSDVTGGATAGQLAPGTVNGQRATLAGFCIGAASTMQAQAFPIVSTGVGALPSGFTTRVDYTATATVHPILGDISATGSSLSAAPGTPVTVGAFSSDIDVTLSNASSNGAKLISGPYQGSVDVTLTPAS